MIPKRIIYCWFGNGSMSDLNKRCMETWYTQCPDYEVIRIDEKPQYIVYLHTGNYIVLEE